MNDSISNTLFRFVSLRSVQIPEPATLKNKFVGAPSTVLEKGLFAEAVLNKPANMSKYEAMLGASKNFKEVIPTEQELQKQYPKIYGFSNWLAQNKSKASEEEIMEKASTAGTVEPEALEILWNNIFYQSTVQENGALKDRMVEIVKANHLVERVGLKAELAEDEKDNLIIDSANAHLLLPSLLFDEDFSEPDNPKEKAEETPKAMLPDRLIQQKLKVSESRLKIEQIEALRQDLEVLADEYQKEYQEAYQEARDDYNKVIAPLIREYEAELEAAREKYCSAIPPDQRKYDPNDPCQQVPAVPFPELPEFKFEFKPELSDEQLKTRLDPVSYQTLMECIGYKEQESSPFSRSLLAKTSFTPQEKLNSVGTFNGLNSLVKGNLQLIEGQLSSNLVAYTPVKSVGGVLLPVSQDINNDVFEYSVCGKTTNLQRTATVFFRVPDASWDIATITVSVKNGTDSNSYILNNPNIERNGNQITIYNVEGFPAQSATDTTPSLLGIEILFTNNCVKQIPLVDITAQHCWIGQLIGDCSDVENNAPPFIPKKFGVRLLGVADYKKVEQTVHCYIEGEVSNIENVMAREYREKATRRLRRTEDTTTETNEREEEAFTDTITTDRYEMQTEIDAVLQQNKSTNAYVNTGYSNSGFHIDGGIAQASNTSQEESTRRSVAQAKDITLQAQDRVINKVKKERIRKVIEEFEENNKHGFDNRRGDKHVVGVYRWVDKLYKNQVYNYGRRMMLEFMVPEPGRLHTLSMKDEKESVMPTLKKPIDPRTSDYNRIATSGDITEISARYWAAQYSADVPIKPNDIIYVSAAFAEPGTGGGFVTDRNYVGAKSFSTDLPEDYFATRVEGKLGFIFIPDKIEGGVTGCTISIGKNNESISGLHKEHKDFTFLLPNTQDKLELSITGGDVGGISVSMSIKCELKDEAYKNWQQECFQAIMEAYNEELRIYNEKVSAEQSKAVEIKGTNPGFYRQIENTVLRKNCISYLIRSTDMGKRFTSGNTIDTFFIHQNKQLDEYAALVKFMEQAFEWDLISYNFYPFYWAERGHWSDLYTYDESDDPIFRNFIQSGMARVIVTVRPGFEKAVQLYMSTGKIWNGGEVPDIDEEMFVSMVEEIRNAEIESKEGKAWITRIPTSLTILQAKSAGLEVEKALPCNCDDTEDFENPDMVPCSDSFVLTDDLIGGDTGPEPDPID